MSVLFLCKINKVKLVNTNQIRGEMVTRWVVDLVYLLSAIYYLYKEIISISLGFLK